MQGWIDLFRSLGESLIEVLRAEVGSLQEDLKRSGRHLGVALAFLGGAVLLVFWVLGLLVFSMVAVLSIWLQLWAAALLVLALFLLLTGLLAGLGVSRLRRVENPVDSVKRHVDEHLDWWQNGLLAAGSPLDIPAAVPPGRTAAADFEEGELP
jgi:putative superfamily III holin-X